LEQTELHCELNEEKKKSGSGGLQQYGDGVEAVFDGSCSDLILEEHMRGCVVLHLCGK
jgi:hypothetical protein